MAQARELQLDVVIFGGGVAGLWLLDELMAAGYQALLLEAHALGHGQTIASQGILHGGLKYTLQGIFTPSADAIREMPNIWRDCLAGRQRPRLTHTNLRSAHCYLWQTDSASSRLGMFAARTALRIKPVELAPADWPAALAGSPRKVYRLDEPVIDPASLLADLSRQHHDRIVKIDSERGLAFDLSEPGRVAVIRLTHLDPGGPIHLRPSAVVFAAGRGNAELQQRVGLSRQTMQLRPLHMVVARGNESDLPPLFGHCIDGRRTRLTITSATDSRGRTVWQIGGQVAEDGVEMDPQTLVAHAQAELAAVVRGVRLDRLEWSTYRVNRAEAATPDGRRPDTAQLSRQGNVLTAWPTKLVLAPHLAKIVRESLDAPDRTVRFDPSVLSDLPRPRVAQPPWETEQTWFRNA